MTYCTQSTSHSSRGWRRDGIQSYPRRRWDSGRRGAWRRNKGQEEEEPSQEGDDEEEAEEEAEEGPAEKSMKK